MMEIRVMVGNPFYNEDSELIQIEGIRLIEDGDSALLEKAGHRTTLKTMYADGWTLKSVVERLHLEHHLMLFLERK